VIPTWDGQWSAVDRYRSIVKALLMRPRGEAPVYGAGDDGQIVEGQVRGALAEVRQCSMTIPPRPDAADRASRWTPAEVLWRHLPVLGGVATQASVDRLVKALRRRSRAEIGAFAEGLATALWQTDSRDRFEQPIRDVQDPPGVVLPMSSNPFLHARCAVVAAGHETFQHVLATPSAIAADWDMSESEHLLFAAPAAWRAKTGEPWDYETAHDYETGSNTSAWTSQPTPGS
jgi:hypothetical protein